MLTSIAQRYLQALLQVCRPNVVVPGVVCNDLNAAPACKPHIRQEIVVIGFVNP